MVSINANMHKHKVIYVSFINWIYDNAITYDKSGISLSRSALDSNSGIKADCDVQHKMKIYFLTAGVSERVLLIAFIATRYHINKLHIDGRERSFMCLINKDVWSVILPLTPLWYSSASERLSLSVWWSWWRWWSSSVAPFRLWYLLLIPGSHNNGPARVVVATPR